MNTVSGMDPASSFPIEESTYFNIIFQKVCLWLVTRDAAFTVTGFPDGTESISGFPTLFRPLSLPEPILHSFNYRAW